MKIEKVESGSKHDFVTHTARSQSFISALAYYPMLSKLSRGTPLQLAISIKSKTLTLKTPAGKYMGNISRQSVHCQQCDRERQSST